MTKTQLRKQQRIAKGKCPRCGGSPDAYPAEGQCYKCRARRAVRRSVKRKRLIRKSCEHTDCDVKKTEFHHTSGYRDENRQKGIWLCAKHHLETHSYHKNSN